MIMSSIISGKKYRPREYMVVIVISCGMFLFLIGNEGAGSSKSHNIISDATHVTPVHEVLPLGAAAADTDSSVRRPFSLIDGLLILSLYLTFDSFTSNWQEKLNTSYQVSPLQMMAVVNFFSILLTITSLAQQSHLIPSLLTVLSNQNLTRDCFLMSLSSATGQLMIFYTISEFGALTFTFIMTLRQVFAIILSCLVYGHSLNEMAIAGIFIVFVGLFAQIYFKSRKTIVR
jgi:adenosine 3'-phospho 5'-phosphosulfate transporter B2